MFFCCIAMSGPLAGVCRSQEPGHETGAIQLAIEPFDPRAGTPRMKQQRRRNRKTPSRMISNPNLPQNRHRKKHQPKRFQIGCSKKR